MKEKVKLIDLKFLEDNKKLDKNILKAIKEININIKEVNLNLELGTENACLTSIIVPVISTVIAVLLNKKIKNCENQIFLINPVYCNQNLINIVFSGIFEFKMNHIISMIYVLNKRKGVGKYERTSNRGAYDYSYE